MISSGVSLTVILAVSPENATIVCFGFSNQVIIRTNSRLTTVSWPSGLVHVAHRGICMPPFLTSLKIPIRRQERNCRVAIDAEHDRVDLIVNLKTADAPATKATFENTPNMQVERRQPCTGWLAPSIAGRVRVASIRRLRPAAVT
jgi:hypothetical protein